MSESTAKPKKDRKRKHSEREETESDKLAHVIKGVHKRLKQNYIKSGKDYESVWTEHSKDEEGLKTYADAMQKLATEHWAIGDGNRIEWMHQTIQDYYKQGLQKWLDKDERRRQHTGEDAPELDPEDRTTLKDGKLELLDVGSCYNPFSVHNEYKVTAIDLQPANDDVYKCDFLNVSFGDQQELNGQNLTVIRRRGFDLVTFSLLLEYLPSPEQRWRCVVRAWEALKFHGLLVVVTPDSHKQHRGAARMKQWKQAIESAGFHRVKYEKLEHLHGLAFRKVPRNGGELSSDLAELLTVPQDFNTEVSDEDSSTATVTVDQMNEKIE